MNGMDRRDEILRRATRGFNEPPPVPREEIWAGIVRARAEAAGARSRRGRRLRRARIWVPAAAAAVLAIGFGLGRLATPVPVLPPASGDLPPAAVRSEFTADAGAYRQATYPLLGKAERMLTRVVTAAAHVSDNGGTGAELGLWTADLLAETRLLLDSPAAEDPEMRHLLEDLELSLVRLAHLSAGRRDQAGWIDDTLTRKALLSRLRQATPADDIVRF